LQVWENRNLGDLSLFELFWSEPIRTRFKVRSIGCVADRLVLLELLLLCLDVAFLDDDGRFFLADFFFSLVEIFFILG
jgi:hypothetical protein